MPRSWFKTADEIHAMSHEERQRYFKRLQEYYQEQLDELRRVSAEKDSEEKPQSGPSTEDDEKQNGDE